MVLSNAQVMHEITAGNLVFDPPIPEGSERFGSSSTDLLLHEELIILPQSPVREVRALPAGGGDVMTLLRNYGQTVILQGGKPETIEPHIRAVGKTLEHVTLPGG
jgi:hypothetical protein